MIPAEEAVLNIVKARQISQVFFFALFLWFCIVASLGETWWQLRGWPVNLFLQLDPLVALGTVITTVTLYSGLIWALATIVLTVLLGRFFCGWGRGAGSRRIPTASGGVPNDTGRRVVGIPQSRHRRDGALELGGTAGNQSCCRRGHVTSPAKAKRYRSREGAAVVGIAWFRNIGAVFTFLYDRTGAILEIGLNVRACLE